MKKMTLLMYFLSNWICSSTKSQPLSLEKCYQLAEQHYPAAKQKNLIVLTREYSIENARKGYLPQINMAGQATYQSDVTGIPVHFPGVDIPA